jgi:putative component of membrane protein insertase Oxa1/YidC/SpoIIIJ protein YidD
MGWVGIAGVWLYRWFVRPFMRRRCLYDESCSQFAIRTFREHGLLRGLGVVRRRVRSCRMPAAVFVIGPDNVPRLLSATGYAGSEPPPRALEYLAAEAANVARGQR